MFRNLGGSVLKSIIAESRQYLHQTHYDVLGLPKNCTSKDIKDAYIKLSKRYHPDKNARKSSHNQFVKVAEAYNILSKPDSRRNYDWELTHGIFRPYNDVHPPQRPRPRARGYAYDDPSFWANRNKYQDRYYEGRPYYGVPGIKRVSNGVIAFICVLFSAFGVTLQYLAIRHSMTLRRDVLDQKSKENAEILAKLQAEALENGNELQIELMEKKILNNYNKFNSQPNSKN